MQLTRRTMLVTAASLVAATWQRSDRLATAAGRPFAQPHPPVWSAGARRGSRLFEGLGFWQVKDPCLLFDGMQWHVSASARTREGTPWQILHATAPTSTGPFESPSMATLHGVDGPQVAAPGVVHDAGLFHLFIQTAFSDLGGTIEHLVSADGNVFERVGTAITSDPRAGESCIYDPQPVEFGGDRFVVYAAAERVGQPDLHLARSTSGTWDGPWQRLGPILRQSDVNFQNQPGTRGYEWGLEGPQLTELPGGGVLLNAVCFLSDRERGNRQRLFFARAANPLGPYEVLGIGLEPTIGRWDGGENGHAGVAIDGDRLVVVYQGRRGQGRPWSCGSLTMQLPR
jgi:hypothetical protein